ncbi:MAG: CpaF family protein, partial [Chloroflexi bacterium]|nr:CpaF family protein [Chloroflexota bacterium]
LRAIREQISSAVDLIVHQQRMRDGTRRITNIAETLEFDGEKIVMNDIFLFEQTGIEDGKIIGSIRPTGYTPKFMPKIEDAEIHLPPSAFQRELDGSPP